LKVWWKLVLLALFDLAIVLAGVAPLLTVKVSLVLPPVRGGRAAPPALHDPLGVLALLASGLVLGLAAIIAVVAINVWAVRRIRRASHRPAA
jgi:hypothetical protein